MITMDIHRYINVRSLYWMLKDRIVRTSLILIIFLSLILCCFLSLFAGFVVFSSYVCGVISFNILCTRESSLNLVSIVKSLCEDSYTFTHIKPQYSGCHICEDINCKRQKPTKDTSPWQGLYIPKEIDQAIQDLFNKLLNEFVAVWYGSLSKDEYFIYELRRSLRYAASVLLRRALEVNIAELITDQLVTTGFSHVNDYLTIVENANFRNVSIEVAAVEHLGPRLHPAVKNRKTELNYLRGLTSCLMSHLTTENNVHCRTFTALMKELVAGWVLLPLSDTISDPAIINSLVLLALSREPLTQYPDTQPVQVEFLQRFVAPPKDHSAKKSTLYINLSTILKDQNLLYTFMQFLKRERAVHVLQFCLDVEEFNRKMLSPDLKELELENLHREAWDLFSVYFKSDSPDNIHFSKHIIQQMLKVLNGGVDNITKLRTSTPLFQAYEVAYSILEENLCPLFHQSDEYFLLLCGQRLPTGYVKSNSRVGKKSSESGTVAKLSNKIQKILQIQPVVGSTFYTDTPLDLSDTVCADELHLQSFVDSNTRDLSAWRVSIPEVIKSQESNTKPYLVFIIRVQRIDVGCGDYDYSTSQWEVPRKYNDFYTLQAKLTEFHGEFDDGTQLPPKKVLTSAQKGEFSESRRKIFEDYLQRLLQKPTLRGSDLLYTFLQSPGDFTTSLSETDGIGKMLKRSVQPIKLRKERGQHLDNFLNVYLTSTEGYKKTGKHEYQDVNYEPPRRIRNLTKSIFKNNFQEALDVCAKERKVEPRSQTGSLVLTGPWDCILFFLVKLMNIPISVLQFIVTIKSLLGSSADFIIKKYLDRTLRRVLVPPRIAHLVRLLQGALFGPKSTILLDAQTSRSKITKEINELDLNVIMRFLLKNSPKGVETLCDCLQHPILNKHLAYCLLDEIVRCLYPELAAPSDIM